MSLFLPGASVNSFSLTSTPGSEALRFGLTVPLADCVQGRALTLTVSAALLLLATVIVLTAPAWAARALGWSARAMTAPPATAASTPATAIVLRPVPDTISCTPRPSLLADLIRPTTQEPIGDAIGAELAPLCEANVARSPELVAC